MTTKYQVLSSRKKIFANSAKITLLGVAVSPAFANAAFTMDVTDILDAITVIVASVTSVGLAALSVFMVTKAFKYIKSAM